MNYQRANEKHLACPFLAEHSLSQLPLLAEPPASDS